MAVAVVAPAERVAVQTALGRPGREKTQGESPATGPAAGVHGGGTGTHQQPPARVLRTDPVPQVALFEQLDVTAFANYTAYEAAITLHNYTISNATVCQKVSLRQAHSCFWYGTLSA